MFMIHQTFIRRSYKLLASAVRLSAAHRPDPLLKLLVLRLFMLWLLKAKQLFSMHMLCFWTALSLCLRNIH